MKPVIVFDVLFRLLRQTYGVDHVTYARNITDVDDKINARAAAENVSIRDLTERTAAQFHADIAQLGVLPPTVEPRATDHIPEMRALCEQTRFSRDDNVNPAVAIVHDCVLANELLPERWAEALNAFSDERPARTKVLGFQIMAEIALVFDRPALAIEALRLSSNNGLIDITWLDRCPLFDDAFTSEPEWKAIHDDVSARAARVLAAFRAAGG